MSKANKPTKVLRTAIRRIQRFGWTQHTLVKKPKGSFKPVGYCLMGSVVGEGRRTEVTRKAMDFVKEAACEHALTVAEPFRSHPLGVDQFIDPKTGVPRRLEIAQVNDYLLTSQEDALLVLKHALVKAECAETEEKQAQSPK